MKSILFYNYFPSDFPPLTLLSGGMKLDRSLIDRQTYWKIDRNSPRLKRENLYTPAIITFEKVIEKLKKTLFKYVHCATGTVGDRVWVDIGLPSKINLQLSLCLFTRKNCVHYLTPF